MRYRSDIGQLLTAMRLQERDAHLGLMGGVSDRIDDQAMGDLGQIGYRVPAPRIPVDVILENNRAGRLAGKVVHDLTDFARCSPP